MAKADASAPSRRLALTPAEAAQAIGAVVTSSISTSAWSCVGFGAGA